MRKYEILNEAFDFTVKENDEEAYWAVFDAAGVPGEFVAEGPDPHWHVYFEVDNTQEMTDRNEYQHHIMSTIGNIMDDFIKSRNPSAFGFAAAKIDGLESSGRKPTNRVRFYRKLMDKVPGYTLVDFDESDPEYASFKMVRDNNE